MSHAEETRIASTFNSSKFDIEPGYIDNNAVMPTSCAGVAAAAAAGLVTAFATAAAIVTYQHYRNGSHSEEEVFATALTGDQSAQSLLDARYLEIAA